MTRKSMKAFDRKYRKIRNRIIVCLILILVIFMFWNYISNLHHHIDLLAKYNHQQNMEINQLQHDLQTAHHENARLESAVLYQHNVIETTQQHVTYITNPETSSIKVQFHHNTAPTQHEHMPNVADAVNLPTTIVFFMTMLSGVSKLLMPIF